MPGPAWAANTPLRLPRLIRLKPSAIPTPTRSCRHRMGRMSSAAACFDQGVARIARKKFGALALENLGNEFGAVHGFALVSCRFARHARSAGGRDWRGLGVIAIGSPWPTPGPAIGRLCPVTPGGFTSGRCCGYSPAASSRARGSVTMTMTRIFSLCTVLGSPASLHPRRRAATCTPQPRLVAALTTLFITWRISSPICRRTRMRMRATKGL